MKYKHIKNGTIAEFVEQNDKFKTITLRVGGDERPYSISTIKRWWREIPDEEFSGDGTSYQQVMEEIIADEEKHVEEVMKQKKELDIEVPPATEVTVMKKGNKDVNQKLKVDERPAVFKSIIDKLKENGMDAVTYERIKNFILAKAGKKSVLEIRVKRNSVLFNCKEKDLPKKVKLTKVSEKYYMPIVVEADMSKWESVFDSLLVQIAKNYGKEE